MIDELRTAFLISAVFPETSLDSALLTQAVSSLVTHSKLEAIPENPL